MKAWPEKLKKHGAAFLLTLGLCWLWAGAMPLRGGAMAAPLLVAAGLAGWWWWRNRRNGATDAGHLRCLDRLVLQSGSVLYLVEVEGKKLLLAAGEKTTRLLVRVPGPPTGESEERP